MSLERSDCLIHERNTIRKKQDALCPVAAHEEVGERDDRPGLPCPSRHHEKSLPFEVVLECLPNPSDGSCLVVPLHDGVVDLGCSEWLTARPPLDEEFQVILRVEALHLAWRVHLVIPNPRLVAVGVEDHGPSAELLLQ